MKVATKNQKNASSWTFVKWLLESSCSYVFKNHSSSFYYWRYVLFCRYGHNLNHYHSCHSIQYDFIFNFITILSFIMYHYCTNFFFLLYFFVILSSILFHFFSFFYFFAILFLILSRFKWIHHVLHLLVIIFSFTPTGP